MRVGRVTYAYDGKYHVRGIGPEKKFTTKAQAYAYKKKRVAELKAKEKKKK